MIASINLFIDELERVINDGDEILLARVAKLLTGNSLSRTRNCTVEPVLGTLINFMGLRRIWTRGIKSANKFMLGAAIAYNLKKWMNYPEQKRKTAVMAMKKWERSICLWLLMLCGFTTHHNIQSSK